MRYCQKNLIPILSLLLVLLLCSCGAGSSSPEKVLEQGSCTVPIYADEVNGGVYLDLTIGEFESLGFSCGDSCGILFSDGTEFDDVPYLAGDYGRTGEVILTACEEQDRLKISYCHGDPMWKQLALKNGDTVTVTLTEEKMYLFRNNILGADYSSDGNDYPDAESFANFRALTGGSIRENLIFRGASPVDNSHGRAEAADELLEKYGIGYAIDLTDTEFMLDGYEADETFSSDYFSGLYESGVVSLNQIDLRFGGEDTRAAVAAAVRGVLQGDGPYYIFDTEGIRQTGLVGFLLEALAGASPEELREDYMVSFTDYFGYEEGSEEYDLIEEIYYEDMVRVIAGLEDSASITDVDCAAAAENYLREGGMTEAELDQLRVKITE